MSIKTPNSILGMEWNIELIFQIELIFCMDSEEDRTEDSCRVKPRKARAFPNKGRRTRW